MARYNYEYDKEWKAKNTVYIGIRLCRGQDSELIEHFEGYGGSKMGEARRLMRLGLKYE